MASTHNASTPNNTTLPTLTDGQPQFRCFFIGNDVERNATFYHQVIVGTCVFNALFSLTAVLGNSLTMAAILRTPSLRNPASVLLFSLAMIDFGVGLIVQPSWVMQGVASQLKNLPVYCVSGLIFQSVGIYLSLISFTTVGAINFERYLALALHMRYQTIISSSRAVGFCIATWLLPIPLVILRFWFNDSFWFTIFAAVFISSLIVIVFVAVFTSYTGIFVILRRHRRQIQDQANLTNDPQGLPQRDIVKYRKSVFTMLFVLGAFVFSYVPYIIIFLVGWSSQSYTDTLAAALKIGSSIVVFNATLNPVLYCWRIVEIRSFMISTVKRLLC